MQYQKKGTLGDSVNLYSLPLYYARIFLRHERLCVNDWVIYYSRTTLKDEELSAYLGLTIIIGDFSQRHHWLHMPCDFAV